MKPLGPFFSGSIVRMKAHHVTTLTKTTYMKIRDRRHDLVELFLVTRREMMDEPGGWG